MSRIRRSFILLFIVTWAWLAAGESLAGEDQPDISVKAEVNRAFITIGDPVEYTVTIRHLPDIKILSQVPPPAADMLKIKKVREFKEDEKGSVVEGRVFTLTTFRLGEFILDPVKIQYRRPGKDVDALETDRIFLTVKSVAGDETKTDIRGVKPVIPLPYRIAPWLLIGTLAVVGFILILLWKRWKEKKAVPSPPAERLSPEDEALRDLDLLMDSDLLRKGKLKAYFLRLSEILRVFFEKRYEILAVESTTFEIMKLLKGVELNPHLQQKIQGVLETADLVKFAKWKPEPAEIVQVSKQARDIVIESRPAEASGGI